MGGALPREGERTDGAKRLAQGLEAVSAVTAKRLGGLPRFPPPAGGAHGGQEQVEEPEETGAKP